MKDDKKDEESSGKNVLRVIVKVLIFLLGAGLICLCASACYNCLLGCNF